jgi:hydroxymethylpyrimidine pyrophosphatase-like HAD family hydrolase
MTAPLVALDLDGTLLTEESRLTAGHERAVTELRRRGAHVAIVTGRPVLITAGIWRRLGLTTPAVCFNGGWVGFPGQPAMASLRHSEARPEDFAPWNGPSFKVMYVADPALTPAIVRDLRERFRGRFHVVLSQSDRLEILPKGISKVWGLSRLAELLGVPRAQVWSVGDAENDLEMVAWAGHGCAMGHGPERLLAVARHVLPGIHARGLCALPLLMERHGAFA